MLIIKVTLKNISFFLKTSKSEVVKNFRKFLFQNPDWLITFWSRSQKPEFSQIWDFSRNTANNINFHYRTNSVKIDDKLFQSIWLSCTKSGSVMHNFISFSSIMPKFRKNWWYNSRKMPGQMEGWKERQKDRQTLFFRTLPTTAGGLIICWRFHS